MLVPLFAIPALFIVSGLLFGARRRPPGQADDDGGDGGSGPPFDPPDPPLGGPPLPDAEPSRGRLRDHDRPARTWRARRRDRAHPVRTPVRTIQNA
jgi:hypothetical protein